jgi:hypothetical protein
MAIKKIIFTIPRATSLQYTAIGGVRLYDDKGVIIDSGVQVSSGTTSGETENFLTTATSSYTGSSNYLVPFPFDTNKPQTTNIHTSNSYWLTEDTTDPQILTIEFKTEVSKISKIEFVPRPDGSYTNRGVDADFTIDIQDETYSTFQSYTVTPIITNNTVQTLSTSELTILNKTLISFANEGDYKTYNNGWQTVSTTLPSQSQFETDGMDALSVFDRQSKTFTQDMTNDGTLGAGLKFSTTIDLKKYFDITDIRKI